MFFCGFSGAPEVIRTTPEQPHFTYADDFPESINSWILGAPAVIRTTLEQIAHHEILLLRGILA
jgi:hypothetical protein